MYTLPFPAPGEYTVVLPRPFRPKSARGYCVWVGDVCKMAHWGVAQGCVQQGSKHEQHIRRAHHKRLHKNTDPRRNMNLDDDHFDFSAGIVHIPAQVQWYRAASLDVAALGDLPICAPSTRGDGTHAWRPQGGAHKAFR